MKVGLDSYTPQDRKSVADVRYVVTHMIRDLENLEERKKFSHGVSGKDLREWFTKIKHYEQERLPARLRDNVYLGYFARHEVHGKVHFYPLHLHKDGLIDHSRCLNCQFSK